MVPRFVRPGRSFKGVMLYLAHDAGHASTSARVAWTHTLNLAHDHIGEAVDEMMWTARHAELLKAEAGVHGGGTVTQRQVKHFSLNWAPGETPDRAHMIETAQSFLPDMNWHEHQAILVCHIDRPHPHVHVVLNAIHPETGKKLDDGFEQRRASNWALAYEQSRGQVYCLQRQLDVGLREATLPRPAWIEQRDATQREAELERLRLQQHVLDGHADRLSIERTEWVLLKKQQKAERLAFFAEGKRAYGDVLRQVTREVRAECRPLWARHYKAGRAGLDPTALAEQRAELIERQKTAIDQRSAPLLVEPREQRDEFYRDLLAAQKAERAELVERQERGLRSPELFAPKVNETAEPDRDPSSRRQDGSDRSIRNTVDALDRFGVRRGRETGPKIIGPAREPSLSPSRDLGSALAGGMLSVLGSLGDSMIGGHSALPRKADPVRTPEADALDRFGVTRGRAPADPDAALKQRARQQTLDDEWFEWRKRSLDR